MNRNQKKIFYILIPIVLVIIIITILGILYLTTDLFKSNQTLFLKYASQNADTVIDILDNTSEKELTKMLHQNQYEVTGMLTAQVNNTSDGQENSDDINNLKLQIKGQSDYKNSYDYRNAKVIYGDNQILELDAIHDGEVYGIKFTDEFSQYLSAENNNLKELAQKCGMTEEQIANIPNKIEEIDINELLSFTYEETTKLKETYLNLLLNNISADNYTKQKNAVITVNDQSITTNAYKLTLTQEQANNVYIKILEQLKNDEIILNKITQVCEVLENQNAEEVIATFQEDIDQEITNIQDNNIGTDQITYTVYQVKGQTVRTTIEDQQKTMVIDLNRTEEKIDVAIQTTISSELDETTDVVHIIKSNTANNDEFSIEFQSVLGEVTTGSKIYRNKTVDGNNINVKTGIILNNEDLTAEFAYNQDISIVQDMERSSELDEKNNVILNNYEAEQISQMFNLVKEKMTPKLQENEELINSIMQESINTILLTMFGSEINITTNSEGNENVTKIEQNGELSDVEKNRFNSKFEFYSGTEVSKEDVQKLMDVVKDNLGGAQVSYSQNEDASVTSNEKKELQSIRLKIEKDKSNEELAGTVMDLIEENNKYNITIQYDESTNIVSYITIEVNK